MMRVSQVALGVVVVGSLVMAAPAIGSRAGGGGAVRIFATPSPSNPAGGTIVVTGAIGDYGTTLSVDKSGKTDANGNFVRITLKKGTFMIDSTRLNAIANKAPGVVSKATCSFSFSANGPVSFFSGTGAYNGISGTANVTITFAGIGPLYASGKHKGQCNMANNAKSLAQFGSITGTGAVKFA